MTLPTPKYFVYRHIRLDKNQPFYIGRGTVYERHDKDFSIISLFWRAYSKVRNEFWKSVADKTEYDVEIIYQSNSFEEICEKEKEFIFLYGRRDLGTGTLTNMSEGGDGGHIMSDVSKKKMINSAVEAGIYERFRLERSLGVHIYNHNGGYLGYAKNKDDCGLMIKCSSRSVNRCLYNKIAINGFILSRERLDFLNISEYSIPKPRFNKILKIGLDGKIVNVYESWNDAVKNEKGSIASKTISRGLADPSNPYKKFYWKYERAEFKNIYHDNAVA